jgi:hypothetical protein
MGQLLGQGGLTNPGTALMSSASGGEPLFIGTPSQVQQHLGQARQSVIQSGINNPVTAPRPQPAFPVSGQPSFQQAATAGATAGGANALSPGLNKAGKLVTLLTSGLQGALAGQAARERMTAETGGRRSGGIGTAFEAGYTLPWQRQAQMNQLAQQQAQTGVLQSEAQTYNIPGVGQVPGWLAKAYGPAYLRQQGELGAAQTRAGAQVQGAQIGAGSRVQAAEISQRFKAVPGVGLFDTNSRQVVPGTAQAVMITPEIAQDYQLPQEFIGKPMNVGQLASLERAQNQQTTTVTGAAGPALVNKRTAKTTPLGLGSPSMGGIVPVANPNNPGEVTYAPKSQAVGMASPQGAATAGAKAVARSEVPTKIGDQKVAFNTAMQHADLLQKAASALDNGDQQTLAGLKNRFKNEFGAPGPVTAQAIADAYTREVTKMLSAGHLTDAEIGTIGKTLNPSKQNMQQISSVIGAYKALAQSKLNMLNQQANAAKGGNNAKANDPLGIRP